MKNLSEARSLTFEIIEVFEDLLEEKGIQIPDDDRTGDPNEAPLYGTTYAELEDKIFDLLVEHIRG